MTINRGLAFGCFLLATLALTSCAYAAVPNPVMTTRPDGTTIVTSDADAIALTATPSVSVRPALSLGKLPAGWTVQAPPVDEGESERPALPASASDPIRLENKATGCYLTTSVLTLPANEAGRGDLAPTRDAFATYSSFPEAVLKAEKVRPVATATGGTIDFYTGLVVRGAHRDWVAVRAIDHPFDAQNPSELVTLTPDQIAAGMTLNEDAPTGALQEIPAMAIVVSCDTDETVKWSAMAKSILKAFTVKLTP